MAYDFNNPAVQQFLQLRDALAPTLKTYVAPNIPAGASAAPQATGSLDDLSPDEQWIVQRESGGRVNARNPHSTAAGIGQLIRSNREYWARKLGLSGPDTLDRGEQIKMFRAYVASRYGTAAAAKQFWQKNHWY